MKVVSIAHGTVSKYVKGCRCADCTASNTAYHSAYRARPNSPQRDAEKRYQARKKGRAS